MGFLQRYLAEVAWRIKQQSPWKRWMPILTWPLILLLVIFLSVLVAQDVRLSLYGVSAQGKVIALTKCFTKNEDGTYPNIHFVDAQSFAHTVVYQGSGCGNAYHENEMVYLRYLPDDPTTIKTESDLEHWPFGVSLIAIFCLLLTFTSTMHVIAFVRLKHYTELYARGVRLYKQPTKRLSRQKQAKRQQVKRLQAAMKQRRSAQR